MRSSTDGPVPIHVTLVLPTLAQVQSQADEYHQLTDVVANRSPSRSRVHRFKQIPQITRLAIANDFANRKSENVLFSLIIAQP